ncbi:non-homologous end-joining DNA ligase [Candidatus Babela massiliensis]|uniref:DNA ligase (ATP) n=1 Tax=Candidatus Babela massiliensis TaxID=673862 RepID=V6DIT8_9BACT|nr:non-homologous end-joining DNA ligase [Candidatus Babela massiliensis]CDK30848.1 ATP-dependent DNA ligase [Candidatus Babela massiliensis]
MKTKIKKIISKLSLKSQKEIQEVSMPKWVDPMLATLTQDYFSSDHFISEHKWDGERIIAYKSSNKVSLMTRNKKLANDNYPELVKNIQNQAINNFILDGEMVAQENNKSNFSVLQKIMHSGSPKLSKNIEIFYYVFDIIYLDKYDLTNLELIDRKFLLENSIEFKDQLKFTEYYIGKQIEHFKKACQLGWEGLIVKNIHSKYEKIRSKSWLKFKCFEQQELVITGYTDPQKSRVGFGALLLGYYENNKLIYAGKVGAGFNRETLKELKEKLSKIEQKDNPFNPPDSSIKKSKSIHWVLPKLVAEIRFSQWTAYNKLRHPRFMGLRYDKDPKEVIKEIPQNYI